MIRQKLLEDIIGRLEHLQNSSMRANQDEQDAMRTAKDALLRILR